MLNTTHWVNIMYGVYIYTLVCLSAAFHISSDLPQDDGVGQNMCGEDDKI